MKPKAVTYRHTMFNAETETPIATCKMVAVHLDLGKRKALPFPSEIQAKCQTLLADG